MMKKKILELDKKHIWHPFTQIQGSKEPIIIINSVADIFKYHEDGGRTRT